MDEKEFKKHLRDLVHGHHHPEEHDWPSTAVRVASKSAAKTAGKAKPRRARKTRKG